MYFNQSRSDSTFSRLFRNSLVAILLGIVLTLLCYLFVDRSVAYYVYNRKLSNDWVLRWVTDPPPILQAWTPIVLASLVVRRCFGPFQRWELAILTASIGMIIADQFRESLRDVFGRYWPETWINENPSLIRDGAYGFHLFQTGSAFGSFPSGHSARTAAIAAPFWIAYPQWRWVCGLAFLTEATALIGMNYHFVSDVIAGGFVGGLVGAYTTHFCGLEVGNGTIPPPDPS